MTAELDSSRYLASRTSLECDGFVVLPASFFPFSSSFEALRTAATRSAALTRAGKWPHIRTLPKQFPPWSSDPSNGIWGVQHLLHPDLPDHATFARSYFDKELLQQVRFLIGCEANELVMELYNLLVRPDKDFALRWHRDDIPATATAEEEMERLRKPAFHAQWNLALYGDASLVVVPGSHKRARTDVERAADPYEDNMPGQKVVHLNAGDVVFYDNNILHRGVYDASVQRMTLHGSIGYTKGSKDRARNVLQHGIGEWVGRCKFSDLGPEMSKRAEGMRDRLVEMGKVSGDVGFFSKEE